MSANLDRLINLAKKSGSTLIIHDEKNGDVVLMDVDSYEMMLDMQDYHSDFDYCHEHEDLYDMSEIELLDKINRDIGIWRSYREDEDREWNGEVLAKDLADNPPTDPFEEDYTHAPEWHKAGDILTNRHSNLAPNFVDDQIPDYFVKDISDFSDPNGAVFGEDDDEDEDDFNPEEEMFGVDDSDDNLVYDSLGQAGLENKTEVPFAKHEETEIGEEEDLDSEPVFFEEPV